MIIETLLRFAIHRRGLMLVLVIALAPVAGRWSQRRPQRDDDL